MVGQPEGVVARGGRDHPALARPVVQQQQGVARAAFLERPGALEVLQLAINPRPGRLRERDALRTGRDHDGPRDAAAGGLDVSVNDGVRHGGRSGVGKVENRGRGGSVVPTVRGRRVVLVVGGVQAGVIVRVVRVDLGVGGPGRAGVRLGPVVRRGFA